MTDLKNLSASEIIAHLKLEPLPGEGGFFRETYRAAQTFAVQTPGRGPQVRSATTSIYFLITPRTFSALHRIPQDEIFHFYLGGAVEMLLIKQDGSHQNLVLGSDLMAGQQPQLVVPGGTWQGARLISNDFGFALLGTTVAPAFEFADREMGIRAKLIAAFPHLASMIEAFTL